MPWHRHSNYIHCFSSLPLLLSPILFIFLQPVKFITYTVKRHTLQIVEIDEPIDWNGFSTVELFDEGYTKYIWLATSLCLTSKFFARKNLIPIFIFSTKPTKMWRRFRTGFFFPSSSGWFFLEKQIWATIWSKTLVYYWIFPFKEKNYMKCSFTVYSLFRQIKQINAKSMSDQNCANWRSPHILPKWLYVFAAVWFPSHIRHHKHFIWLRAFRKSEREKDVIKSTYLRARNKSTTTPFFFFSSIMHNWLCTILLLYWEKVA